MEWSAIAQVYDPLKCGSIDSTDTDPHDHAVIRAMKARYKPNKLVCGDPKLTLFVARLNPATTEGTLREFFSRFGPIRHCRLVRDIVTGFSKCYAFVEFKEWQSVAQAHRETHKSVLENHEIMVDYELERTLPGWIPRRLGGGFGGKKESGQLRFGGRDRLFKKPIVIPTKNRFFEQRRWNDDRQTHNDRRGRRGGNRERSHYD